MKKSTENVVDFALASLCFMICVGGIGAKAMYDKKYKYVENTLGEDVQYVMSEEYKQYEKHIAYYTQKSGITMDGAITKPAYFVKVPAEFKTAIINVKDLNKELLKEYLSMKFTKEEQIQYERDLNLSQQDIIVNDMITTR